MGDFFCTVRELWHDGLGFVVCCTGILLALFLSCVFVASAISCSKTANAMGMEHKFSVWTGCLVKVNDRWVPFEKCTWLPNGKIEIGGK